MLQSPPPDAREHSSSSPPPAPLLLRRPACIRGVRHCFVVGGALPLRCKVPALRSRSTANKTPACQRRPQRVSSAAMAWRPPMPPMRHDAPRAFPMGDRAPHPYGAPYGPPFTNIFRPPGAPLAPQFAAPSRPLAPHAPSFSLPSSFPAAAATPTAASSAKSAEALAQQQASDDSKRACPSVKGKLVAQCKRKFSGTEELKVMSRLCLCAPDLSRVFVCCSGCVMGAGLLSLLTIRSRYSTCSITGLLLQCRVFRVLHGSLTRCPLQRRPGSFS